MKKRDLAPLQNVSHHVSLCSLCWLICVQTFCYLYIFSASPRIGPTHNLVVGHIEIDGSIITGWKTHNTLVCHSIPQSCVFDSHSIPDRLEQFMQRNLNSLYNNGTGTFYPLPNNKILDMTKLKAYADNKLNVDKNDNFSFRWVENSIFSFSLSVFQGLLLWGSLKVRIVWWRVNINYPLERTI